MMSLSITHLDDFLIMHNILSCLDQTSLYRNVILVNKRFRKLVNDPFISHHQTVTDKDNKSQKTYTYKVDQIYDGKFYGNVYDYRFPSYTGTTMFERHKKHGMEIKVNSVYAQDNIWIYDQQKQGYVSTGKKWYRRSAASIEEFVDGLNTGDGGMMVENISPAEEDTIEPIEPITKIVKHVFRRGKLIKRSEQYENTPHIVVLERERVLLKKGKEKMFFKEGGKRWPVVCENTKIIRNYNGENDAVLSVSIELYILYEGRHGLTSHTLNRGTEIFHLDQETYVEKDTAEYRKNRDLEQQVENCWRSHWRKVLREIRKRQKKNI